VPVAHAYNPSPIYPDNVVKPSIMVVHLEDTKKFILERSPMNVNSVVKSSLSIMSESMKEFILKRSPVNE
jgi:hypothetical protein